MAKLGQKFLKYSNEYRDKIIKNSFEIGIENTAKTLGFQQIQ